MLLVEQIDQDLRVAMKAKDANKVSVLRMVKSAEKNAAIEKRKPRLDDPELIKVIGKLVKQRRESIEEFKKGNRQDLVDKESGEIDILLTYLPKELDEAELEKLIDAIVKETGAKGRSEMGKIMKLVMEKVGGQVDGKVVSQKVSAKLSG